MSTRECVAVAMSGGVDSSVAAALLQRQGCDVVGLTLQFRPSAGDALHSAREVARLLGVPHHTLECHDAFDAFVLRPAWHEYAHGRTPNPCVVCNMRIKWGLLFDHARTLGATRFATGHYARITQDAATGEPILLRGLDPGKDQSYFLFGLGPDLLRATLLPLGALRKTEVRDIARSLRLPNAQRAESQDMCFVADQTEGFAEALRSRYGEAPHPGTFVDTDGHVLGEHTGVHNFTIGQRRGLGVALGQRAYVVAIRPERREVVLSCDEARLEASGLRATGVRWSLAAVSKQIPFECEVQVRYRHKPVRAAVTYRNEQTATVQFAAPVTAVTPGQAVVLYDDEIVLGGGWIEAAL